MKGCTNGKDESLNKTTYMFFSYIYSLFSTFIFVFLVFIQCCLAAIIVVALRGMFRQCKDLKILWKYSKTDFVSEN